MDQLEGCTRYYERELQNNRAFLNPSMSVIFESTLKYLKELKEVKRKEEVSHDHWRQRKA